MNKIVLNTEDAVAWMKKHPMKELTIDREFLDYRWNPKKRRIEYQISMSGNWYPAVGFAASRFFLEKEPEAR